MTLDIKSRLKAVAWKPKFQAFAVHFSISLLIFLTLLYLILFHWYPSPFFTTDGGTQGLRLIIFVDLVLGPTLTFIVFKRNKPSLKFDLAIIAVVQAAALSYGIWTVHNERPVAVIFADDTFHPIPYYEFRESGHKLTDLKKYGDHLPVTIYVELPAKNDLEARLKLFRTSFVTRTPLFMMGERYRRLDKTNLQEITTHAVNMDNYLKQDYLKDKKARMQQAYHQFLRGLSKPPGDYLFLALYARYCKCFLVAERATLKFVDVLKIPPPQITQTVININPKQPGSSTPSG